MSSVLTSLRTTCSAARFAFCMTLLTACGLVIYFTVRQVRSSSIIYIFLVWFLFMWMWLSFTSTAQGIFYEREGVHDNENHEDRDRQISLRMTQILGSELGAAQRSPMQYGESAAILFNFGRRTHIARLAMEVLPPVKSFAEDETTGSACASDCPICMEDFKNGEIIQPFGVCVHEFHSSCISSWLHGGKTTCPVCRKDLSAAIGK